MWIAPRSYSYGDDYKGVLCSILWVIMLSFGLLCSAGNVWRKSHNLPMKDFHITLTENDVHGVPKNASSLLDSKALVTEFPQFPPEKQDHVLHHLHLIRSGLTLPLTVASAVAHLDSANHFVRLGDAAAADGISKLAILAYAYALRLDSSLHEYVTRRLRKLVKLTHYGPVMSAAERDSIPTELVEILVQPWCEEARQIGHTLLPLEPPETVVTQGRDRLWYKQHELPRFFSWIVPYFLAGMSTPRCEKDVDALAELGITRILTLTQEEPLPASWFAYKSIKNIFIPVANYMAPTFQEVDYFIDAVTEESDDACWLVHCGGGKGRAGTMLACYIALYGFQKPAAEAAVQPKPCCDAGTVIRWLRTMRPGSIETPVQEAFVANWISYRWKQKTNPLPEPQGLRFGVQGRVPDNPELLLLVGLPGSGKSWFSSALQKRRCGDVDVISQDECGSRSTCEIAIGRRRAGKLIILDRCNPSREDRKIWLGLADVGEKAVAVYFDYEKNLCTQRIDRRIDHPTLRAGRAFHATEQMNRDMNIPTLDEGFGAVITIPSFEASREVIKLLGGVPQLYKFPRTQHLINLGGATVDDVISNKVLPQFGTIVVIEEKIDGANMGITLDYYGNIQVQNRSHTVTSQSHAQFRQLYLWLERHSKDLHTILHQDEQFPERYILFGEWVVATHSIHYESLPDSFLAYDFYDRVTKKFASREHVSRLLQGTTIHQVPIIQSSSEGVTENELKSYMTRTSAFCDGPIEGVYVRFEDEERTYTLDRGKVVRANFLTGNEHWDKGIIRENGVVYTENVT